MIPRSCLLATLGFVGFLSVSVLPASPKAADETGIRWRKTQVDPTFRSEGVAVADVNRDGKPDIIVGDYWYEAPDWKPHEIRKPADYGDGSHSYSRAFACFVGDFNHDGWPDVIVVGFPGQPAYWYENPGTKPGHWTEHLLWRSACNETPQYADLFGDGNKELVMGIQPEGQMCWFAPGSDPTKPWEPHPISEPSQPGHKAPGTEQFSHGLGVGDMNGDGRPDVICTAGWWEQPVQRDAKSWPFHPANLGAACADMVVYDINGDGKRGVISSSAHNYGIWWYEPTENGEGKTEFVKHELFPHLFSESHALACVDINGDGLKDLVTGKRWWAHGPKGDIDPNDPPVLYWFEAKRGPDGHMTFLPHQIDDASGIGTQFTVADVNGDGLPDIVVSNKRGVYLFEQVRAGANH